MARIKLIKAQTSLTKRNTIETISKYLPHVNLAVLLLMALRVFDVI